MRHSLAVSENSPHTDYDRPLTNAGRELAARTAGHLSRFEIDLIVSSSAARTAQTAEIVATECRITSPIYSRSLYLADANTYRNAPADLLDSNPPAVLVIGHNPGISTLINRWSEQYHSVIPASVGVFQLDVEYWTDVAQPTRIAATLTHFISGGKFQQ